MPANAFKCYYGIDGCGSNARSKTACFEAEAMPSCAMLFMVMALLPGGIVAKQRRAYSTVEVYFKVEIWGISRALEAVKWKEYSSV